MPRIVEDHSVYFDLDATYDGGTAVKVIFDNEYAEFSGIAGTVPAVRGLAATFPSSAVGKTLVIDGITYTIVNREPIDDGAHVRLRLRRN